MTDIGWVDRWQIRDKKDVHPSHATAVVELRDIRELLEDIRTLIERNRMDACEGMAPGERELYIDGLLYTDKKIEALLAELEEKPVVKK